MYLLFHLPLEHFGKCWAAEGLEAKFGFGENLNGDFI